MDYKNKIIEEHNTLRGDISGNHMDISNNSVSNGIEETIKSIFTKNNVILIVWFLAIYLVAYYLLGFFFRKDSSNSENAGSRTMGVFLDFIILAIIMIFLGTTFFSYNEQERESAFSGSVSGFTKFINEPSAIFTTLVFIIVFYFALYLIRVPMTPESKPFFISLIENIAWVIFLIIIFIDFFKYILGISLTDIFAKLFNWDSLPSMLTGSKTEAPEKTKEPEAPEKTKEPEEPKEPGNEVFNISNNHYTYDTAQSVCSSYGARLATYDEIESAYNDGAEWCNYGWSEGQMAFFPTQKSTWSELQKTKKHENDCGRPGINGGYMANPNIKFGVNCYGKKPKANVDDLARIQSKQNVIVPKTQTDLDLDKKIAYWKQHPELLEVNAFNRKQWNAVIPNPTPDPSVK